MNKIKDLGAVFTPINIINDMLDSLPINIWNNQNLKWLEPCVGIGNIVCEILKRNSKIDIDCFEIDIDFCKMFKETTNKNVICCDFLQYEKHKTYDIIICNPPYQKPNLKNKKARGGKCQLYLDFLQKCLSLLNVNGYLLFITPCNWRKINSTLLPFILNNMSLKKIVLRKNNIFPNISVYVDWYLIQNTLNYEKTFIINSDNTFSNIYIDKNLPFIPNIINDNIQELILSMSNGKKYNCIISCYLHSYTKRDLLSKQKTDIFTYPIFNTSSQSLLWCKIPHKYQFEKKVIMSNSGKLNPFFDNGILGLTQNGMFIIVNNEDEAKNIILKLNSKQYTYLLNICQWGMFRTEKDLISFLSF